MIKYRTEQREVKVKVSITCDCCKKEYTDVVDTQEFIHIEDIGGYNSAIGDCVHYECDLCSECITRLLGKYLRTNITGL